MAKYECAAILRTDRDAQTIQSMQDYLKALLEKNGAAITQTHVWGNRRLAYEIKRQREGFYVIIEFTMKPDGAAIQEMLRLIRTQENILRAIFVNIPPLADKAKALNERRAKAMAEKAKLKAAEEEAQARRQAAALEQTAAAAAPTEDAEPGTDTETTEAEADTETGANADADVEERELT